MKTTSTHIDLDIAPRTAPATASAASLVAAAAKRLLLLVRALRNRRTVMYLEDFTDQQLADIGLTRDDLNLSLMAPWYDDPSAGLARRARAARNGRYGRHG